jgi:23S rRNA pseudouridine1911/1915/1917 synthase
LNSIEVIFEDPDIVVVNKPAGMIVHSAPGHTDNSLADNLAKTRPGMYGCGSRERPGVVHRLDIGTSGVMVFAKTPRAYRALREAFESHGRIRKTYLAVLHGAPKTKTGRIENTIGRKPWDSKRMAADVPNGKRAVSEWTVLAKKSGVSLVEFVIETGRTHQIRVHAADLGCPIVGDMKYGNTAKNKEENATRQHLVSKYLRFYLEGEFAYLNDKAWVSQFEV